MAGNRTSLKQDAAEASYSVAMKSLSEELLLSWERQVQIVMNIAAQVTPDKLGLCPAPNETDIAFHLCHIHMVRMGWLEEVDEPAIASLKNLQKWTGQGWESVSDLELIREQLAASGLAITLTMRRLLKDGSTKVGPYSHPIHFLNHMIWHDGWHVGLIVLALRQAGFELSDEWEEENVWAIWRS